MTRTAIDPELFRRTAPQWNCVDFPGDGMHYLATDGSCQWCGMSKEAIAAEEPRVPAAPKRHYCIPCDEWTDHEKETTLPAEYQCGDPNYEDRSKCGRCGETYQCQECGAPWNVQQEKCQAVIDHGQHGPE